MQQILSNISNIKYECEQFRSLAHHIGRIQTKGDTESSSSIPNAKIATNSVQHLLNAGSIVHAKTQEKCLSQPDAAALRALLMPQLPPCEQGHSNTRNQKDEGNEIESGSSNQPIACSSTESATSQAKDSRNSHNGESRQVPAKRSRDSTQKQSKTPATKAKRGKQPATLREVVQSRVPPKYKNDEKHLDRLMKALQFIKKAGEEGATMNDITKDIDCTMFTTREYLSTLERSGFIEQISTVNNNKKKTLKWLYIKQRKPRAM